ncbi:MAG: tRNA (guanosine(46)-N7)-methyltransferase TrmB, partial [Gammaproteobacteria bacterium]|nr:tRNA (guanosine(46)-N7)-methyltransferase TrmB [Gammaproteobacteria bacterium]
PGTLAAINIFFPDPWPKKRHHKRRLIQPPFLRLLASRLQQGGLLHIATDWANYAEHIAECLADSAEFSDADIEHHRGRTKFERRGLALGHEVYDFVVSRNPDRG